MAVLTGMLGKAADVSEGGFVERRLIMAGARLTQYTRLEQNNCVRFSVNCSEGPFKWHGPRPPTSNDWSVTCRSVCGYFIVCLVF